MALAQDSSTPTYVAAAANFVTTASFTPPAGAVLVAINMHVTSSPTGDRAAAITDSAGLTWSLLGTTPLGPSPAPNGGLAQVWTARVPSSASMTVTATIGTNGGGISFLRVLVFTGADNALQGMVTGASTGLISQALTTTVAGSIPYLANIDSNGWDTYTPGAGTTTDTSWIQGAIYWVAKQAAKTPAGSVTLSSTYPSSGPQNSWLAFAVPPASIINLKSGVAARNGTNSHTIPFGFTSTSGNELVVIVHGAVTHTDPSGDWNERLQPVSSGEMAVFTRTSAGDSSITLNHNGSNYPVTWSAYELPAGSTWTDGTGSNPASDTFPTLSGLPGTAQLIIAARGRVVTGTTTDTASTVWDAPSVEDSDLFALGAATDGTYLTVAHQSGATATSVTPTASTSYAGVFAADRQHVVFAIALGGGGGPATHTAAAALAVTATVGAGATSVKPAAAALAATATITAAASRSTAAAAAVAVTATLTAGAGRAAVAGAALAVTATVSTTAAQAKPAGAALAVTAGISAAATAAKPSTAALAVTATITPAAATSGAGVSAALAIVAAITAGAGRSSTSAAAVAITATLAAAATKAAAPGAAVAVTATLTAAAIVGAAPVTAAAALAVVASLTAGGARTTSGGAALTVTATLAASSSRAAQSAAALTVSVTLTAGGSLPALSGAALAVTAALVAAASALSSTASSPAAPIRTASRPKVLRTVTRLRS